MLQQVVEAYGCSLVEGVLSHQLKQFVIDGNKCILSKVGTLSALWLLQQFYLLSAQ